MELTAKFKPALVIIIVLCLAGMMAIYYSTTWGPWAFSDSAEYIVSARNFLAGRGFSYPTPSGVLNPLTLHPPFYPFSLSILSLLGLSQLEAARWINIFLFGALILLSGIFTYYFYHSAWLAVSLSLVILTIPALVDVSSGAMSELLFLSTITLGFCLLIVHLSSGSRLYLILSAISISLAFLTRYPGIIAILAGIVGLLLAKEYSWKQRLSKIVFFSLIGIAPTGLWLFWVYHQTGSLGSRQYYLPQKLLADTIDLRKKLMELFWNWFPFQKNLPAYSYNLSRNILILLIIIILILFGFVFVNKYIVNQSADHRIQEFIFPLLWVLFTIGYIAFIAASSLFSSPAPDLNSRTLLPVQFGIAFFLLPLIFSASDEIHLPGVLGWCLAILIIFLSIPNAQKSWNIISQYHEFGSGYTSQTWQRSLTLKIVSEFPMNVPIITNETGALLLLADRPAYELCSLPCNHPATQLYGDNPDDPIQVKFREDGAALVYFYPYCGVQDEAWYSGIKAQYESFTQGLTKYFSSCDGAIFFYPQKQKN